MNGWVRAHGNYRRGRRSFVCVRFCTYNLVQKYENICLIRENVWEMKIMKINKSLLKFRLCRIRIRLNNLFKDYLNIALFMNMNNWLQFVNIFLYLYFIFIFMYSKYTLYIIHIYIINIHIWMLWKKNYFAHF